MKKFHEKAGTNITLQNDRLSASLNGPVRESFNSTVYSDKRLQQNELFTVRVDAKMVNISL